MKHLRVLKSIRGNRLFPFLCAAAVLVFASAIVNWAANYGMVYPTPETQSSFLKNYSPVAVIARYDAHHALSRADGLSSDAGRGFASHVKTMDFYFATRPENTPIIPKALCDDSVIALHGNQMRVIGESEIPEGGYRIHYVGGKTKGTVTIALVASDYAIGRRMPLPADNRYVRAEIRVEEEWVKN